MTFGLFRINNDVWKFKQRKIYFQRSKAFFDFRARSNHLEVFNFIEKEIFLEQPFTEQLKMTASALT